MGAGLRSGAGGAARAQGFRRLRGGEALFGHGALCLLFRLCALGLRRRTIRVTHGVGALTDGFRHGGGRGLRTLEVGPAVAALGRGGRREDVAVDGRRGLLAGGRAPALEVGTDEVLRGKGDLFRGPLVDVLRGGFLLVGALEADGDVAAVGGGDQARAAEIVFCLQVLDLGAVGAVDHADWYREDGVALDLGQSWNLLVALEMGKPTCACSLMASSMTSWSSVTFSFAA